MNLGKITLIHNSLIQQDPEENTWEPLDNLGEAEKAIKLFEKEQELKGHAAAKAQGQNNKRTYAKVVGFEIFMADIFLVLAFINILGPFLNAGACW